jgi:hypothetical protein
MICFEVYINGQKVCLAGIGNDGVLAVMATFIASSESQRTDFRVGGLIKVDAETQQQIEWLDRELKVGDDVTIKIVEAETYDAPMNQKTQYLHCSFCGKKQEEVSKLIAGPNNYICNECVVLCSQAIAEGTIIGNIAVFEAETNTSCSFCGKQLSEVERIVGVAENRICNECASICKEIINADAS